MGRPYHFLFPLLSIFLVRVDLTDLIPLQINFEKLEVIDGDTVLIKFKRSSYRMRLLYIDAPEMGQMAGSINLGEFSSKCLKELIKAPRTVSLSGHDQYHRMLGDIEVVSLKMVREGCVYLYEYSKFTSRAQKTQYLLAQNQAQKLQAGLWKFKVLNPRLFRQKRFKLK